MVAAAALACGLAGAARAAETVKVGVLAPFSGPLAPWGTQFREGIGVWQKQHGNSVDGVPIEVIYRDTGGPNRRAHASSPRSSCCATRCSTSAGSCSRRTRSRSRT